MQLNWKPQAAFADWFYTDPAEILAKRTVFRDEIDYSIPFGGRGSAKTWTFADAVIVEATLRPVRVLVTRELQNSIGESIKAELENAIEARGLHHFFDIQNTVIKGLNGSHFMFKGLKNNITNLKSIADVDIVLCEEAENITKLSWDKLLPSIRPRDKVHRDGTPIIIIIYNPENELDDTHQRWAINTPEGALAKLINWRDNKYFPPHLNKLRLECLRTRPEREYKHIWEGEPTGASGDVIIDLEWVKAARFASKHPKFQKIGKKVVGYDPSGQGKDTNAVVFLDGNIISEIDEWVKSADLRIATERAFTMAITHKVDTFRFDECGGLGDGVEVFVSDDKKNTKDYERHSIGKNVAVSPFNAGDAVANPDRKIPGTDKTWAEMYSNAKSQAYGIFAQKLYSTYRFIILGETDMNAADIISLDIEDDEMFKRMSREFTTPLWIKSNTNSKKAVESKKDMEKRTGQPSPNIFDGCIMTTAPEITAFVPIVF
jgi:phage terminase large subunit